MADTNGSSKTPESRWVPLESNPEIFNKVRVEMVEMLSVRCINPEFFSEYVRTLGVRGVTFNDVFGTDPELLAFVPQPVVAAVMLFPLQNEDAEFFGTVDLSLKNLFYMKQTIRNACGTIGLLHAIGNTPQVNFSDKSPLPAFFEKAKTLSPDEICPVLEKEEWLSSAHEVFAAEGQTAAPDMNEDCDRHFVAFVNLDGKLVELGDSLCSFDGRKPGPVVHGFTTGDSFLGDVAEVMKSFMSRCPESLLFSLIALSGDESGP